MKASVSRRNVSTAGLIGSLLVLWAVLVIPGAPQMGVVALAALAVSVTTVTVLCRGRVAPAPVALARIGTHGKR